MLWNIPPKKQVYEALGCLADKRLELVNNGVPDTNGIIKAKVSSSSHGKFYDVSFDKSTMSVMSNDNTAYYKGYLSYPAIALLMSVGIISYNKSTSESLKCIPWKDINQKYNNNFDKVKEDVFVIIKNNGFDYEATKVEVERIMDQLRDLNISYLGKKQKPPVGY